MRLKTFIYALLLCVYWLPLWTLALSPSPPPWPSCHSQSKDAECWAGPYECADCCDTRWAGPSGNPKCWGGGYDYARCCPSCPSVADSECFSPNSEWTCEACCDRRLGDRGNPNCWSDTLSDSAGITLLRSFERCCLGRSPICSPTSAGLIMADQSLHTAVAIQTSQSGQDNFALKWLGCPSSGFYMDIGAYDGEHLSNTHAMDVNLGWRGICIDAVLRLEKFGMRTCRKVEAVIYNESGKIMHFQRFPGHHESAYGGLQQSPNVPDDSRDPVLGAFNSVEVVTKTVTDVLQQEVNSGVDVPQIIDYVSVDLEGAVLAALEGFPFATICVRVFTVELQDPLTSPQSKQELLDVARLLQSKGYILAETLDVDRAFVHVEDCGVTRTQ